MERSKFASADDVVMHNITFMEFVFIHIISVILYSLLSVLYLYCKFEHEYRGQFLSSLFIL